MRVCVGSPGVFSTRKWRSASAAICGQVRDRYDLRPLGEPLQESADGVRRLAADACVDLVEDKRVTARDGCDRERDPRQLAARGGLGDRREREAGVRADEEDGIVGSGRTRLVALAELADELAVAHADIAELGGDGVGEGRRGGVALGAELEDEVVDTFLGCRELARAASAGSMPSSSAASSARAVRRSGEQLLVRLAAEAALRLGDPVELGLELLEPPRLGLERREERAEVGRRLAQAQLDVPQLVAGGLQLRGDVLERRDRSLGEADEARSRPRRRQERAPSPRVGRVARSATWRTRSRSARSRSSSSGSIPSVSSTSARSSASRASANGGVRGQLLVAAARASGGHARRRAPRPGARAARRRRSGRAPRAGTTAARGAAARTGPTSRRRSRPPRRRPRARRLCPHAYARVRPSVKTRRETTSASSSSGRSSPSASSSAGRSSSASTYASSPAAPTKPSPPFAPRSRPSACARIVFPAPVSPVIAFSPGDELELGLADEDEVLDAEPPQHPSDGTPGIRRRPLA